jgi:hypothetical protein
VKAAANYLEMDVKVLQRKTREGKILGYSGDDGPRHRWSYYISDLDDYRHKHCSQPSIKPKQQKRKDSTG